MTTDTETQTIDVDINDNALSFDVGVSDYNAFVSGLMKKDPLQPSHNFCMYTVKKEHKDTLKEILKLPGAAVTIASTIVEEYQPEMVVIAKKRKNDEPA